ncbi:replication restart DNA helicase PriA [Alkalispirochaeta americana]|uniref:Replication restart protein PriA n=1 Tax=Alkalispirochaeta americana TaxID=159291 RepID=A0A1N6VME0_9SPIO|nr:primosomal protein N' [Alkalispirochaeta americana]SIQ79031.1 replication restart DNA helicase PriA [Alkalispirochaeta americana]
MVILDVAVSVPVDRLFSYLPPREGPVPAPGCRVMVPFGRRTLTGVVVARSEALADGVNQEGLKEVLRVLDQEPLFGDSWLEMARWVSRMYLTTLGETLATMLPGAKKAKDLPLAGGDEPAVAPQRLELSQEQEHAIEIISQPLSPGEESWHYLYGITGSGKTEVFLQLAERTLQAGRGVIYLVPEIALTHQLFDHISRRFGAVAAMLHSGLTPARRLGEWRRIQRGEARLVVGARSAVFAPLLQVGLIIIDEEHEGSYKAGNAPRYHARQVALWRAVQDGAACVMGSATPSVEAWHLMQTGRLKKLVLTRRLAGGALPSIRTINIRGASGLISPPLKEALLETHRQEGQSILFLNRRGFAAAFQCRSCGHHAECPRCSVPMTYHKGQNRLVCHYCGHRGHPEQVCSQCGSLDVGYTVFGTERIEEDISRELPELSVARLDTDTTRPKGYLQDVLERFARGEINVLLGTQMVAKGLNFPGVRTVGIIMADTGLNLPDFRAAERTFALIVQVAGRAGRFRDDGQVLVQTVRPEHDAISRAAAMEVEEFYRGELEVRKALLFPPFSRLIRLVLRSSRRNAAEEASEEVGRLAREAARNLPRDRGVDVLGPAPAALERIKNNWRYQIILRGEGLGELHWVCRRAVGKAGKMKQVYLEVDVDPVNLL